MAQGDKAKTPRHPHMASADANSINTTHTVDAQIYFAVIPEWVLDLPISASAVRVYCCLRRYADNKTGECFPSRRTLAMRSRVSIATVDRALRELNENGAIRQTRRKNAAGDWTSNLYTVLALPYGVATNLIPPSARIAATGKRKSVALTRPTLNEIQEQHLLDLQLPKAEPAPTKDGLLKTAAEFAQLASVTKSKPLQATLHKVATRMAKQAKELPDEVTHTDCN